MADCKDIPSNLNDPLLERLFQAADTAIMKEDMKGDYMKSIIGETDYEAGLEEAREAGMEQRTFQIAQKMKEKARPLNEISELTGLPIDQIQSL